MQMYSNHGAMQTRTCKKFFSRIQDLVGTLSSSWFKIQLGKKTGILAFELIKFLASFQALDWICSSKAQAWLPEHTCTIHSHKVCHLLIGFLTLFIWFDLFQWFNNCSVLLQCRVKLNRDCFSFFHVVIHVLAQVHTLVSLVLQTDHSLHCLSLEAFFLLYLEIKEILINY